MAKKNGPLEARQASLLTAPSPWPQSQGVLRYFWLANVNKRLGMQIFSFIHGYILDFMVLRPRYPTHVPRTVIKSPPRPITRDMMLSEENMITPLEFKRVDFDLWRGKNALGVVFLRC